MYPDYTTELAECLKKWAHEVDEVSVVVGEALLVKLPAIEAEDKQAYSAFQSIGTTRKTTRLTSQACQIVTKFCIIRFHRIRVRLAFGDFISAKVIPEPLIRLKAIRVIPSRFGSLIHHLLQGCLGANPDYSPAQNTASFAVYQSDNVDFVFLSPMKVNISSISASFTSFGNGALGNASATSVTQ